MYAGGMVVNGTGDVIDMWQGGDIRGDPACKHGFETAWPGWTKFRHFGEKGLYYFALV
jgi:hypothetical protein